MFELLRYTSISPILVPHLATQDTTLGGYSIPRGTQIWVNAYNLHSDATYWEKPQKFNPNRFLDQNGEVVPPDHINRKRFECLVYVLWYTVSNIITVLHDIVLWLVYYIRCDLTKYGYNKFCKSTKHAFLIRYRLCTRKPFTACLTYDIDLESQPDLGQFNKYTENECQKSDSSSRRVLQTGGQKDGCCHMHYLAALLSYLVDNYCKIMNLWAWEMKVWMIWQGK